MRPDLSGNGRGSGFITDNIRKIGDRERPRSQRVSGISRPSGDGVNSRLDVLNAEVLKFRLTRLKDVIDKRRKNADLYRSLIKRAEFLRAGLDASTARNNSGLFTLTLRGGRVSWTIKGDPAVYTGRYFLSKGTVRYVLDKSSPGGSGPGGWLFSAHWRKEDGGIRLTNLQGSDPPTFLHVAWARLWRRIGSP